MIKTVRTGPLLVFPRGQLIDVFTDTGWESKSTFKIEKGRLRLVEGAPISADNFQLLKEIVK